jgi:ABC-type branched-subunit amino acid transport system substrate-binding protein
MVSSMVKEKTFLPGGTKVALLLPLSGKNAALGQAMLNAAQQAVFDMAPQSFELMPRDTNGGAEKAAKDAISGGAQLFIGPLFASDVAAVKPLAQSSNVNMLALSTDVSLAEPGVYVMGFAPSPQVERVVSYAAKKGAYRFAAVIPATAYGDLVKRAFTESVRNSGGVVEIVVSPSQIGGLAARKGQIDALFLPLGGNELKKAAENLLSIGFNPMEVKILGTGLWDEPGIGKLSEFLVGGWYAASEPYARENFVSGYIKNYGEEPPRLATLAYDATALSAVLAGRGGRFDRFSLGNQSGFAGLDGIFRFTPYGVTERGLSINEITHDGSRIIDPSPSSFAVR